MAIVITQALKEQDKITRHACAENVEKAKEDHFYHDNGASDLGEKDCEDAIFVGDAHRIIINTKSV
jgi:hypothetical protein